jgi:hypothetical protein
MDIKFEVTQKKENTRGIQIPTTGTPILANYNSGRLMTDTEHTEESGKLSLIH